MTNYKTTLNWRGHDIETLADIVDKDLRVLFVGINPSCVSVQEGHYHRGSCSCNTASCPKPIREPFTMSCFWNTISESRI